MRYICFDLEGPLSPEDNAYELMSLFPDGDKIFEIISRYDDLLTLEGKEGYEPGDTLSLIAPFLISHGITETDILKLADKATLVSGAPELISELKARGWEVYCITTSYQKYAHRICQRVGIPEGNIACTIFALDNYHTGLTQDEARIVVQVEEEIKTLHPSDDDLRIKQKLDRFFWNELCDTRLGQVMNGIKPTGGIRKLTALQRFAAQNNSELSDWVIVGDSITDFKMLQAVDKAGGLAIGFNANQYALPYATIGMASTNLDDLNTALLTWETGGRQAVANVTREIERTDIQGERNHLHWISGRDNIKQPLEIHKRIRGIVRDQASKLG